MDQVEREILQDAVVVGRWHVLADTFLAVANLVRDGFISLNDECEGIAILPTEAGKREALRLGLVRERAEGRYTFAVAAGE